MATSNSGIRVERSERLASPVARLSYPTLFTPRAYSEDAEPKFSVSLLVEKNDVGNAFVDKLRQMQEKALTALYPKKRPGNVDRYGIADGDDEGPNGPVAAGCWVVKATNKNKPAVVDQFKNPIEDEGAVYGGCFGRGSLVAKAYGTPNKGGVTLELLAVQKTSDGTPFGGAAAARSAAVGDFDVIEDAPF